MTLEELDELLQRVRMRGTSYNSHLLLSSEQRNAIASVLLPAIQKRIEQARIEEKQACRMRMNPMRLERKQRPNVRRC